MFAWALAQGCTSTSAPPDATTQMDATTQTDAGDPDGTVADSTLADTAAVDVVVDTSKALGCPGSAGCLCSDNTDCDDALCIQTDAGRKCAARCVATCPAGTSCRNVTGGSDAHSYCVPT